MSLFDPPQSHRLPTGVEDGGPAGVDTGVFPEVGVEDGGPAGVDTGVLPEAGLVAGGPPGVFPAGVVAGAWPEMALFVEGAEEPDVPGGVTPMQNCATVSPLACAAAVSARNARDPAVAPAEWLSVPVPACDAA